MMKNYRQCVSCRRIAPKSEFWQIVRQPGSHRVVLDQGMGRSAYLCPQPECLRLAQKKDRFSRALKAKVDPGLYQRLERQLSQENQDLIGGQDSLLTHA